MNDTVNIQDFGIIDYVDCWRRMQAFNAEQSENQNDEIWLCQHPPVITLGMNCKGQGLKPDCPIPIVASDRGGEATYHGPGQLVAYVLIHIRRRGWGVKTLVNKLEQSIIDLLADFRIQAERRPGAPGIYVDDKKIASLGLRIKNGASYHGVALNVDMDLAPFSYIDPCGFPDLEVTRLADLVDHCDLQQVRNGLIDQLIRNLGYNKRQPQQATVILPDVQNG